MKRLNFKTAFTIAEMLVVLIIIGIITAITVHSIRNKHSQYSKLYATAYSTLVQAIYAAQSDFESAAAVNMCSTLDRLTFYWTQDCWDKYTYYNTVTGDETSITDSIEQTQRGAIRGYPRQYPGYLFGAYNVQAEFDGSGSETAFCRSLTNNINTIDERNECKSFITGMRPGKTDWYLGESFLKTFCAIRRTDASERAAGKGNEICDGGGSIIPSFIASNGQRFYISKVLYANPPFYPDRITGQNDSDAQHERMAFRFIVVDLNGDNGPNSQIRKKDTLPDLVLFAVGIKSIGSGATGFVVPLGWPEFDDSYFSAVISYPYYGQGYDPSTGKRKLNPKDFSESMTLFEAKNVAWYGDLDDNWTNSYYGQMFVPDQPFTFSNLFYYWGINCNGAGCSAKNGMGNQYHVDKMLANLVYQFIYTPDIGDTEDYAWNIGPGNKQYHTFIPLVVQGGTLDKDGGCSYGKVPARTCNSNNRQYQKWGYCCVMPAE